MFDRKHSLLCGGFEPCEEFEPVGVWCVPWAWHWVRARRRLLLFRRTGRRPGLSLRSRWKFRHHTGLGALHRDWEQRGTADIEMERHVLNLYRRGSLAYHFRYGFLLLSLVGCSASVCRDCSSPEAAARSFFAKYVSARTPDDFSQVITKRQLVELRRQASLHPRPTWKM